MPVDGWRSSNSWPRLAWRCGDGAASVVVDSVEGSWCDAVLRVKLGCGMGQTCNCRAPVWCGTATACGAPWACLRRCGCVGYLPRLQAVCVATVVRCSAKQWTVRRRRPDGGHILFGRMDYDGHASLWLMETGGDAPVEVCRLQISDALGNENSWFGFYGYTDWRDAFDWRRPS